MERCSEPDDERSHHKKAAVVIRSMDIVLESTRNKYQVIVRTISDPICDVGG